MAEELIIWSYRQNRPERTGVFFLAIPFAWPRKTPVPSVAAFVEVRQGPAGGEPVALDCCGGWGSRISDT